MSGFNNGIIEHLKKINDIYSVKDKTQSLTDILNNFRQVTKDFSDFSEDNNSFTYSNYNYEKCSNDEKMVFYQDQLQMLECLVINSIYEKVGTVYNWYDIYNLLHNDENYKQVKKINRKVVYSTAYTSRPIGDASYNMWNGMQIIDLDIKNQEIAEKLKIYIFNDLCKYNWFLGVCKSASGKGLHVWTKITPLSLATNTHNRKTEYICNFRHKYSFVYITLARHSSELGYDKEQILNYMDMAMCKPQQGIFITSDAEALLNTNFKDQRLDVNFEQAYNTGVESIDWISHPDLKQIFSKLDWFVNDKFNEEKNINKTAIDNIDERNINKETGRKHYKHAQRWQLANTLNALYGEEKAYNIMLEICKDTKPNELRGDVKTASIHNKPISIWAVKELNKYHGFNIKIKDTDVYGDKIESISQEINKEENIGDDPTKILNDKTDTVNLHLNANQYLSDIKDDILKNLSHITLLEAGAGYGKTEMIKAFKAKTLLVLPFTSTIKSKVESSETTKDWLYFYGNKRPTIDDLFSGKSMSMTIDKFSRLNLYELDQAGFEYIVIDESHLLFTSSYREVMSPAIQRIANVKAKVIMMSGTPTGELLFFPGIKHIKVKKDDNRIKEFTVNMVPTDLEQEIEMCKSMAKDICEGRKILYPTNNGNLYYEQIVGLVEQFLMEFGYSKQLKTFYYKKSNYGAKSMDLINVDKTIGDNDIVFCTTYLSVGVDIADKYKFSVYFNQPWMAQDIEQFANRLRNNNLFVKMFLPQMDSTGMPINYTYIQQLNLNFSQKDLLYARDLIQTCNDMLERNEEESKYNPLIGSLISANKFLKYDENECKYFIDETTYKLNVFQERYEEYSKQLPVLMNGMKYYGYDVKTVINNERISESKKEQLKSWLKSCRDSHFDEKTKQTLIFLNHINDVNMDIYKDLKRGNYEVFRDDKYKEERENNNLYVEDIEIMEKNLEYIIPLYRYYDIETIKDIYQYCLDKKNNKINYAKLGRICNFVRIDANARRKRLDFPIHKFMQDARKYAKEHNQVTKDELELWLATYASKYANSVKNVVIDDIDYLQEIYTLIQKLFKVVVLQSRPNKGKITLEPFNLLWERKQTLNNIYGDDATEQFFAQELTENMKDVDTFEDDDLSDKELEHTEKLKLDDVKDKINEVVHPTYDYNKYAYQDGSNERFVHKETNTNTLRGSLFDNMEQNQTDNDNKTKELSLFTENQ